MRSFARMAAGGLALIATTTLTSAATISGTVTGPDNAAFRGAFVQARNAKTHITVSVLSDPQGHYRIDGLAAGDYRVQVRAPGFKAEPKGGIALAAEQTLTHDIALAKSYVRWS